MRDIFVPVPPEMAHAIGYDQEEQIGFSWFRHASGEVTIMFSSPNPDEPVFSYYLHSDGTWES